MRALFGIAAVFMFFCLPVQAQDDEDTPENPGLVDLSDAQRAQYEAAEEAFSNGDHAKALKLIEALKADGVAAAWWLRGVFDFQGLGTKKDEEAARKDFLEAAKIGGGFYQVSLGDLYRDGTAPFPKDCAQAASWYKKAAAGGNEPAKGRVKLAEKCGK